MINAQLSAGNYHMTLPLMIVIRVLQKGIYIDQNLHDQTAVGIYGGKKISEACADKTNEILIIKFRKKDKDIHIALGLVCFGCFQFLELLAEVGLL